MTGQDVRASEDIMGQSDTPFSIRASGSGEHGQPSVGSSHSLDFSSGQAASPMPTPRLMFSTSRGLSLQESGVELSSRPVRLHLAVSEASDRPVQLRIAKKQEPGQPNSSVNQPTEVASATGPFSEDVMPTAGVNDPFVLPKPSIARMPAEPEQHHTLSKDGAAQSDVPPLSVRRGAANIQKAGADDSPGAQQNAAVAAEGATSLGQSTGDAQDGVVLEAREAALTVASLQSSPRAAGLSSASIGAVEPSSSGPELAESGEEQAARGCTELGAGALPLPPEARLVEQQVYASLEPSLSNDSAPAVAPYTAESLGATAQPSSTVAVLSGKQALDDPGTDKRASAAAGASDTAKHSAGGPSHSTFWAAQSMCAPGAGRLGRNEDGTDSSGSSGHAVPSAEQAGSQQASHSLTDPHDSRTHGDAPGLGPKRPPLKGLIVPKLPAGGERSPSAAVSPQPSALRPHAPANQAGADASDHEVLSTSAASDSSDFNVRAQQSSVRDSHSASHAAHVDWNELGKRSSRLALLAGMISLSGVSDSLRMCLFCCEPRHARIGFHQHASTRTAPGQYWLVAQMLQTATGCAP